MLTFFSVLAKLLIIWRRKGRKLFIPCPSYRFSYIYMYSSQVEVERIDIGEPENTGMYDMITGFL